MPIRNPLTAVITAVCFVLSIGAVRAEDAPVSLENLTFPALVKFGDVDAGSGFFVFGSKGLFFVTARHVLFKDPEAESLVFRGRTVTLQSYDYDDKSLAIVEVDLVAGKDGVAASRQQDIAVITIGLAEPSDTVGMLQMKWSAGVTRRGDGDLTGVTLRNLRRMADVPVGAGVFVVGYPSSLGLENVPQLDRTKPLLRKGVVAGRNDEQNTLVLDCPVFPGNSGGPVLLIEPTSPGRNEYPVVGMVIQFVPFVQEWEHKKTGLVNKSVENSGYSIAISLDGLMDLLRK